MVSVVVGVEGEVDAGGGGGSARVGIVVVAYNAAGTLARVLDRIPRDFRSRVAEVFVSDDSSTDSTYLVGLGYKQVVDDLPLSVVRNPENLGYGGNQKVGYRWAVEQGLDIVVLLHGDGQYAPEFLPQMVAPLEFGNADAVFGSRMLERGAARKGGMPFYKYVGNRILTGVENKALGTSLSEFHSGYRAYRVSSLRRLDFESYSDDFDFDTEIIIDMVDKRMRIEEIPIPTFYGDEICYVNGMRYARQVIQDVAAYRFRNAIAVGAGDAVGAERVAPGVEGVVAPGGDGDVAAVVEGGYPFKWHPSSSHGRLLARAGSASAMRVLDLGCAAGFLSEQLRLRGHHVTGVDLQHSEGVEDRTDEFVRADLAEGLPDGLRGPFDLVIAGDVLEHLRRPEVLLNQIHGVIAPNGALLVSVPNFSHWYPRVRVAAGVFGYDKRGILDEDHVRFFTRKTVTRLFASTEWHVVRREAVGVPWEELLRSDSKADKAIRAAEKAALVAREPLFAYQFLFELVEASTGTRPTPPAPNAATTP